MKLDKSKPSPDQTPPQHKLFFADANNGLYELFHVNDNADNDFVMNNLFPMDIIEFMNYYSLVAGKRTMSVLYDLRKEAGGKASVKYLVSMGGYEHIVALIGEKEGRRTAIELQEIIDRMSPIFTKMFGHLV